MIRTRRLRSRHLLAALIALVTALLAIPVWVSPASADTIFPPGTGAFTVSLTVNGTTYTYPNGGPGPVIPNVQDGDTVTVSVADIVGDANVVNFARLRTRQCAGTRPVSNNTEFNPQITNRCSTVKLGTGSNNAFVDSGPVAPGTTSLSVTFKIGVGNAPSIVEPVFEETIPGFSCNSVNACKIVVNAEASNGTGSSNYLGFPITFAPGPLASLQVTPAAASIAAGGSQAYQAEGFDAYGYDLGNVTPSTNFSIGPDGSCAGNICTATVAGSHVVTATKGAVSGTASLNVTSGALSTLALSPASATITAGASQTYSAEGFDAYGNDLGDVTAATTLSIGPDGSCTANSCTATITGAHTVTGTDGVATGTANLTVSNAAIASLVLAPATASIGAGGSQVYTAEGFDSFGNDVGDVTAATTFSIGPDGSCTGDTCTATATGSHTVTGTNGAATGTASLSVTGAPVASLVLSPATATITAGGTQAYAAEGFDAFSNDLGDFTAFTTFGIGPNGSCTGNVCTAGLAGSHTVTGTSGAATATASLTVNPGPVATISLAPASATVGAGQAQAYTAQGFDAYGNPLGDVTASTNFSISPDGSCTGSSCTPQVPGAHTVTGTGGSATGTASLIVKKTPAITWPTPKAITYPTALSSKQLNAKAKDGSKTLAGTFTYSPVSGSVLPAGTNTLSVTFTPTDTAQYVSTTATVSLVVNQATPTITWAKPAPIPFGTALSGTELNATGSVAGTFTYDFPAGTVFAVGSYKVTATFNPTDSVNYKSVQKVNTVKVTKATTTSVVGLTSPLTYGSEDASPFTITVTSPTGAVPDSGKVTIKAGTKSICTATLGAGGTASCTVTPTKLAAGTYQVTALYAGNGSFLKSTSPAVTLVINP